MQIRTPRTINVAWSEALEMATQAIEPLFIPVSTFADDRGWSYMNLLAGAMSAQGQLNYSVQYPGVVKSWHRHDKQTDFWLCLTGHIKAGMYRETDNTAWMMVIGERRPGVLVIPPPLWHGVAVVGPVPAGLLYYVTHKYDPKDPDEYRRPWDSVDGFPWETRNG